jgi:hypothetical protein
MAPVSRCDNMHCLWHGDEQLEVDRAARYSYHIGAHIDVGASYQLEATHSQERRFRSCTLSSTAEKTTDTTVQQLELEPASGMSTASGW